MKTFTRKATRIAERMVLVCGPKDFYVRIRGPVVARDETNQGCLPTPVAREAGRQSTSAQKVQGVA
jgi:hypothetical protein